MTNAFVSVPADMGQLNCAAFLAGIIAGVLDSARFVSHILYSIMSIQQASCNLVKLSFVKDPDRGPWTVDREAYRAEFDSISVNFRSYTHLQILMRR